MQYTIVRIEDHNYHLFDDMVFWRMTGKQRSQGEKKLRLKDLVVPKELSRPGFYVYGVKTKEDFVGWIAMSYIPKVGLENRNGFLYVDELWVEASNRRKGYAEALMAKADELCDRLGVHGIRLGVNVNNPSALSLYKKCGYISTGQAYTMEKTKKGGL